jgi:hypothetical protein
MVVRSRLKDFFRIEETSVILLHPYGQVLLFEKARMYDLIALLILNLGPESMRSNIFSLNKIGVYLPCD